MESLSLHRWCHATVCVGLALLSSPVVAAGASAPAAGPVALSQVGISLRVPISSIEDRIRGFVAARGEQPPRLHVHKVKLLNVGEVAAAITHYPDIAGIALSVSTDGRLTVKLPISVDVRSHRSGVAWSLVGVDGCGAGRMQLTAVYRPHFEPGLRFSQERLSVDAGGYRCKMGAKRGIVRGAISIVKPKATPEVDIAARIREQIESTARELLQDAADRLAGWVYDHDHVRRLASRPVIFGGVIALGIDLQRVVPQALSTDGEHLKLSGVIEGRPRLHFGSQWPEPPLMPATAGVAQAFALPARALFPRDRALLPAAAPYRASDWGVSDFRIQPVPNHADLAILQRRQGDVVDNIIWLSGGVQRPTGEPIRFDKPIDGVLDEILAWLDDPARWRGVAGIDRLIAQVREFRRLVEQFQQPTRIPLDAGGQLVFSGTSVDLLGVWVTGEAIWADVVLRGKAELDLIRAM